MKHHCVCIIILFTLLSSFAFGQRPSAAVSTDGVQERICRVFGLSANLSIASQEFEKDALKSIQGIGTCGKFLELLFERSSVNGLSTELTCGGTYLTLFWYERQGVRLATYSIMIGFDSTWRAKTLKGHVDFTVAEKMQEAEELRSSAGVLQVVPRTK